jgi:ferritin-like metal-binding protein YciE
MNREEAGIRQAMPAHSPEEQLVKYLADAHSVEEQALTQLRLAPRIAGSGELSRIFREHLAETERHERLVRERLEAHEADPSRLKDLAGKAGGFGMALFAKVQPDTPGKLTAHAFSYEHMEVATYELLERAARAAGDEETAAVAKEICAEEREMAARLERSFDRAVESSLREQAPEDLEAQLVKYLTDAHSIEGQAIKLLEGGEKLVEDEAFAAALRSHLAETRRHEERVTERLHAHGAHPSKIKDAALRMGGLNLGGFFGAQPDTTAKLAGFAFAFEHLEIAAYELLKRVAERCSDPETVAMAEEILAEERAAAEKVSQAWDEAMRREMAEAASA